MTDKSKETPDTPEEKPKEERKPEFRDTLASLTPEQMKDLLIQQNQDIGRLRGESADRRVKLNEFQSEADKAAAEAAEAKEAALKEQGEFQKLFEAEKTKVVDLEGNLTARDLAALRERIAVRLFVDRVEGETLADKIENAAKFATRLTGTTEEEITESATELLALIPEKQPKKSGSTPIPVELPSGDNGKKTFRQQWQEMGKGVRRGGR
jgi:hypothetical protein